jgi:AcrR family transcriptional regulator
VTRPLTAKGTATRGRIVVAAAELIRANGVESTGLDAVLAATATSKGQLFHYFPAGRADLLFAVAEHEAAQVIADQQPQLDQLGSPGSWKAWRDVVVARYRAQGARCPISALTSQLRLSDERIGPLVSALLEDWHARITAGLRRAGLPTRGHSSARRLAGVILAAIQGGVSLLIATGDIRYLESSLDAALQHAGVPVADRPVR